jgi:hypothetical protein
MCRCGALEALREFQLHVVILDIAMPHLDGYEIARRIRREPSFEGIPIVACTRRQSGNHYVRARAAGSAHGARREYQTLVPTALPAGPGSHGRHRLGDACDREAASNCHSGVRKTRCPGNQLPDTAPRRENASYPLLNGLGGSAIAAVVSISAVASG